MDGWLVRGPTLCCQSFVNTPSETTMSSSSNHVWKSYGWRWSTAQVLPDLRSNAMRLASVEVSLTRMVVPAEMTMGRNLWMLIQKMNMWIEKNKTGWETNTQVTRKHTAKDLPVICTAPLRRRHRVLQHNSRSARRGTPPQRPHRLVVPLVPKPSRFQRWTCRSAAVAWW